MIKITKKLIANERLLIHPSWVSNGHWLIRKDCVSNSALFASADTAAAAFQTRHGALDLQDDAAERLITPLRDAEQNSIALVRTVWTDDRGRALYRAANGRLLVLLNGDYAGAIEELGTLLISPVRSDVVFVASGGEVIALLMPCTSGNDSTELNLGRFLPLGYSTSEERVALLKAAIAERDNVS